MNTNRGPQRIDASLEKLLGNLNAPSVDVLDVIFRAWSRSSVPTSQSTPNLVQSTAIC